MVFRLIPSRLQSQFIRLRTSVRPKLRSLTNTFASMSTAEDIPLKKNIDRAAEAEEEDHEEELTMGKSVLVIDPSIYDRQLKSKTVAITARFREEVSVPDPEVFPSPPLNYRMRAEFQVWHVKETNEKYFIMHQPAKNPPKVEEPAKDKRGKKRSRRPKMERVRVDTFPAGSVLMNELMPVLLQGANESPTVLGQSLFQVNLYTTLSKQCMITMLYHRKLDDEWRAAAEALRLKLAQVPTLQGTGFVPHIIGRARKQRVDVAANRITETVTVEGGKEFRYVQVEETFTQPNAAVCQHMLSWARKMTKGSEGGLIELYCGNGNFSIALAENFKHVVATELSAVSVEAAKENLVLNGVDNITLGAMSSEEFSQAWFEKRQAKGLPPVDWSALDLRTIFVDPPRAGLDPATVDLCRGFDRIVYISCNPDTLLQNMVALKDEFEVTAFALFDQFPYTTHMEAGVVLQKRAAGAGPGAA